MFLQYFGLTDNPFSIAPNPDYLYMSPRHKEALAHLTFGLRESGGFVMLTGEVGTGKTTVSRKLLQQLPDSTQVAMILNPTLSAIELLAAAKTSIAAAGFSFGAGEGIFFLSLRVQEHREVLAYLRIALCQ